MAKRNNSNPVSNGSGVEGVFAVYQYFTRVKLTAMPDRFLGDGCVDGFCDHRHSAYGDYRAPLELEEKSGWIPCPWPATRADYCAPLELGEKKGKK